MFELIARVLGLFMFLSFVLVVFGVWGNWTLILAIALGFVYMFFTHKPLDK